MKSYMPLTFVCMLFSTLTFGQNPATESKIDSLLRLMTLEEKLGQLNQTTLNRRTGLDRQISEEQADMLRKGEIGSFLGVVGAEETRRIQQIAVEKSRLHIPLLFGLDVIHGFRTEFPIPLGEACTWNPLLIEQEARAAAAEASAAGIHWTFAPMVDIARDPRWGRIAEGAGEDPYLGSAMSAARVRGFQGTNVRDQGTLLACAKHFAAYGAAEAGRDYNSAEVSERTLREIYLPPFKAAVDAGAWSLMSAFDDIAGIPSSANRWLITDVLRGEWGFKGFVVSDWTSIVELQNHRVAGSRTEAGILGLTAGVDMDMVGGIYQNEMQGAVRSRQISEDVVDLSVRRVLRAKFAYGLFDNPYRNCDTLRENNELLKPEHVALARTIAQQSIVLLKNAKNLLPLERTVRTIALIGPLADDQSDPLGPWSASGRSEDVVTVREGVRQAVSPQTKILYAKGCGITGDSSDFRPALRAAQQADVVIAVLGEDRDMSGEASSRSTLDLPGRQSELLAALRGTGKPVVLVIMNGRPLVLTSIVENADAILEAWFLGTESGNALADVLFGVVSPSGKLPVSFPRSVGQIPLYYYHRSTGRPIVDSDKYTSKYLDIPNTPLYPFGYGLSYSGFKYDNLRLSSTSITKDQSVRVTVNVENTGKHAADEIVQLYIEDEVASIARPVEELKGFRRITLSSGTKQQVEFVLTADDLSFYDRSMHKVVEPRGFKVFVGGNSVDVLETEFFVK